MNDPESVKVVLIGESGVGKTSIISKFTTNVFDPQCPPSLNSQFITKTLEFPVYNKSIKFDIWDTVGQEKYRSLAKIFYRDAKVIIFVYDITSEPTFNAIKTFWIKEIQNNTENNPLLALVGNKCDLYIDHKISNSEGEYLAKEMNSMFTLTSALSNTGIMELFENIGKKIIDPNYEISDNSDKIAKENYEKKKKEENKFKVNKKDKRIKLGINNDEENNDEKGDKKKKCC